MIKQFLAIAGAAFAAFILIFGFSLTAANAPTAKFSPENVAQRASALVFDADGHGSGVVIAPNLVVTAAHVVGKKTTIRVSLSDGSTKIGHVLWAGSAGHDVALIAVDTAGVSPAAIDCRHHARGYEVFTFGNPLVARDVVTWGKIASNIPLQYPGVAEGSIILDMTVNPGNSGGGVYGRDGRLVGLADAVMLTPLGFSVSLSGLSIMVESPVICRMLARS